MKRVLFGTPVTDLIPSLGLLLYRLVFAGFMLLGHGWGKLMSFSENAANFPDPLGIGPKLSMGSAIFCEVFCAAFVIAGLLTRVAVIPLIFTMAVAALLVHAEGPLFMPAEGAKEPALIYLVAFALLLFTGPGRFSLDWKIGKRK
ncbi:MAG: DoxX family protein [Kiritimatiellales bacterium]|nr:DoxX family protein [Kiritimatiellales bacterium]